MSASHADCPVYQQAENRPLPPEFRTEECQPFYRFGSTGRLLVLFIGILLLGIVGFYFFQPRVAVPATMPPSQTVPTAIRPPATIISPTNRPAPTSTMVPTPSSAPQLHSLEIPVTGGERKFLVHLVGRGDTFETIAAAYDTTPEVIRVLNYSMKSSLWANSAIVISPGLKTVDPTLPAFQTHKILEGETDVDQLAEKLKVDPLLLRQYNNCTETCSLTVGDWLIVPVSK